VHSRRVPRHIRATGCGLEHLISCEVLSHGTSHQVTRVGPGLVSAEVCSRLITTWEHADASLEWQRVDASRTSSA
jgi:hypothetical protein